MITKITEHLAGIELSDVLKTSKQYIGQEVHHSEIKKYNTVIDATIKAIDKQVEKLLKEIT